MPSSSRQDDPKDYHRKAQENLRLSDSDRDSLQRLARYFGVGKSGVVTMLIRDKMRELKDAKKLR